MRVCLTEITAKLILNLTLHGWLMKKVALNGVFPHFILLKNIRFTTSCTRTLLWKKDFIKELCKKSFENILDYIIQNSACTQKRIISASIKILQIKSLPLSAARVTLKRISRIMHSILRKRIFHCHQMFRIATRQLRLP